MSNPKSSLDKILEDLIPVRMEWYNPPGTNMFNDRGSDGKPTRDINATKRAEAKAQLIQWSALQAIDARIDEINGLCRYVQPYKTDPMTQAGIEKSEDEVNARLTKLAAQRKRLQADSV